MKKNRNEMSKEDEYNQEIKRLVDEISYKLGAWIGYWMKEGCKKGAKKLARKFRQKGNKTIGDGSVAKEGPLIEKQYCCENCGRDLNELKTLPIQFKNQVVCPECFKLLRDQGGEEPLIQREDE